MHYVCYKPMVQANIVLHVRHCFHIFILLLQLCIGLLKKRIFSIQSREIEIPCKCIPGITKSSRYQLGKDIDSSRLRSEWNAVLLDGQWRLLDISWASPEVAKKKEPSFESGNEDPKDACAEVQAINEFFFLVDPDKLIYTHYPDDSRWQLLPAKVNLKDFENYPFVRDSFFRFGVFFYEESHHTCRIETADGQVYIQFGLHTSLSKTVEFRHVLHTGKEAKSKEARVEKGGSQTGVKYEGLWGNDYIKMTHQPEELRLAVQLPNPGRYKLDIHATDRSGKDPKQFSLLCSYLLIYQHDGLSFLEVHFLFPVPSEHARYMRRGGASEWLKRKDAALKVMGNEMIVSFAMPKGANNARRFLSNFENRSRVVPHIVRTLLQNIPDELNLREARDIKSPEGSWNLGPNIAIQFRGHFNGLVRTPDGAACLRFYISSECQLWYEIHELDRHRTVPTDAVNMKISTKSDPVLVTLNVTLRKPGDYNLNLFTRDKTEPNKIFHVKTYLVQYELLEFV